MNYVHPSSCQSKHKKTLLSGGKPDGLRKKIETCLANSFKTTLGSHRPDCYGAVSERGRHTSPTAFIDLDVKDLDGNSGGVNRCVRSGISYTLKDLTDRFIQCCIAEKIGHTPSSSFRSSAVTSPLAFPNKRTCCEVFLKYSQVEAGYPTKFDAVTPDVGTRAMVFKFQQDIPPYPGKSDHLSIQPLSGMGSGSPDALTYFPNAENETRDIASLGP